MNRIYLYIKFLLIISIGSYSGYGLSKDIEIRGLECSEKIPFQTTISFYISYETAKKNTKEDIENNINRWIEYSNMVLRNSCIPMVRINHEIIYPSDITDILFKDIHAAHTMLDYYENRTSSTYYGIIFSSYKESYTKKSCGSTDALSLPNFFILAYDCTDDILEHELGHLAGAQHDIKSFILPSDEYYFNKYYHGYICEKKGTIMSYEKEIIPIYSSPHLYYKGKSCGDIEKANNRKILYNYAMRMIDNINK